MISKLTSREVTVGKSQVLQTADIESVSVILLQVVFPRTPHSYRILTELEERFVLFCLCAWEFLTPFVFESSCGRNIREMKYAYTDSHIAVMCGRRGYTGIHRKVMKCSIDWKRQTTTREEKPRTPSCTWDVLSKTLSRRNESRERLKRQEGRGKERPTQLEYIVQWRTVLSEQSSENCIIPLFHVFLFSTRLKIHVLHDFNVVNSLLQHLCPHDIRKRVLEIHPFLDACSHLPNGLQSIFVWFNYFWKVQKIGLGYQIYNER